MKLMEEKLMIESDKTLKKLNNLEGKIQEKK